MLLLTGMKTYRVGDQELGVQTGPAFDFMRLNS